MEKRSLGIYVHFPFCRKRCVYCDFYSTTGENLREAYVKELTNEIRAVAKRVARGNYVDTVYFGGGTPSTVPFSELKTVADAIRDNFDCRIKEFTVETNPSSSDGIERYGEFGANRISFGIQSLNDKTLAFLGRLHDRETALKAVERANGCGYGVSADLMLGVPGETAADTASFINELSDKTGHVSAYILKVEKGTALEKAVQDGTVAMPSDEEVENLYFSASAELEKNGFRRYEISNFAKPGQESLHNLKYWRGEEYLGFGAAAHSYFDGLRYFNTADIKRYIAGEHSGNLRETAEEQTAISPEEEFLMLGLRLSDGVSLEEFQEKFGKNILSCYSDKISLLKDFLAVEDGRIKIKPDKILLQNAVLSELFS